MKDFDKRVFILAVLLGDPRGQSLETIDYIASELQVSYADVRRVFKKQ